MRMINAIANVGDKNKAKLVPMGIIKLAEIDVGHRLSTAEINQAILEYHGSVALLRSAQHRNILFDALSRIQARDLCKSLGLSGADPWRTLKDTGFQKFSSTETDLFDWFEISENERPSKIREDPNPDSISVKPSTDSTLTHGLFAHQQDALARVRTYLNSEKPSVLLHMPTGSGKTRTAMNYVCEVLNQTPNGLVVWLAFNGELCNQAATELQKAWTVHGTRDITLQRFWGDHSRPDISKGGVIFAGLDKLWSITKRSNAWLFNLSSRTNLVVFDEAHQAAARTYSTMTDVLLNHGAKLFGLSATPGRTYDDPETDEALSNIFARQKVALEVSGYDSPIDYLVAEEYLSRTKFEQIYSNSTDIPEKALKQLEKGGDLTAESLAALSQDELRNLLIVQNIKSLIKEKHTRIIVFANSVDHAKLLSTYMNMRTSISTYYITGMTPPSERESWINRFKSPESEPIVLFNYGVLTTGFDAPKTSAAIISRPTRSLVLYSQMVGRAIRGSKVEGTPEATVLTVIDQNLPGFRDLSEAFTNWEDVWD